jgi:hypothetical protein
MERSCSNIWYGNTTSPISIEPGISEKTIHYQVKVKLSLCLTKHHAMKTYSGSEGIAPRILDLSTGWRWVVSFKPRSLCPQGKSHWIGSWMGPRAVLDAVAKRKIPSPRRHPQLYMKFNSNFTHFLKELSTQTIYDIKYRYHSDLQRLYETLLIRFLFNEIQGKTKHDYTT